MSEQTEQTRTEPTVAAIKAADRIWHDEGREVFRRIIEEGRSATSIMASMVDEETGIPEVVEAMEYMVQQIEAYAKTNGWTELSEGVIRAYEQQKKSLARLKGEQDG